MRHNGRQNEERRSQPSWMGMYRDNGDASRQGDRKTFNRNANDFHPRGRPSRDDADREFRDAPAARFPAQASTTVLPENQQAINPGQVSGSNTDVKDGNFDNFPEISSKTVQALARKGITQLFPIQSKCFYPMYNKHHLIARDLTGSGKTFAFALPVIEYLRNNNCMKTGYVQAIMIAPTRELALQITSEIDKIKHYPSEFSVMTVYGGGGQASISSQASQLRRGVDLFVGTTGRVLDHIQRGNINFSGLKTVILDEADVMLKLGFKEDIETIMASVKQDCKNHVQIGLFSATMPSWVRDIARTFMRPSFKEVDLAQDLSNKTARNVNHLAINVFWRERFHAIQQLLSHYGTNCKTIIFTRTKKDADRVYSFAKRLVKGAGVMHGDIAQHQREMTINGFKNGRLTLLVATDVASRGLDIPQVDLIVQTEPPQDTELYIHRSGRTARVGRSGICITLYDETNEEFLLKVQKLAGIKFEKVKIPTGREADAEPEHKIIQRSQMTRSGHPDSQGSSSIRPAEYQSPPVQPPSSSFRQPTEPQSNSSRQPAESTTSSFRQPVQPQAREEVKSAYREAPSTKIFNDIIKNIMDVKKENFAEYRETARKLIEMTDSDPLLALQRTLAYAANSQKYQPIPPKNPPIEHGRSLLTKEVGMSTLQMTVMEPISELSYHSAISIIEKHWPSRTLDKMKSIKSLKDKSGIIFDINSKDVVEFIKSSETLIRSTGIRNIQVEKCESLPELQPKPTRNDERRQYEGEQRRVDHPPQNARVFEERGQYRDVGIRGGRGGRGGRDDRYDEPRERDVRNSEIRRGGEMRYEDERSRRGGRNEQIRERPRNEIDEGRDSRNQQYRARESRNYDEPRPRDQEKEKDSRYGGERPRYSRRSSRDRDPRIIENGRRPEYRPSQADSRQGEYRAKDNEDDRVLNSRNDQQRERPRRDQRRVPEQKYDGAQQKTSSSDLKPESRGKQIEAKETDQNGRRENKRDRRRGGQKNEDGRDKENKKVEYVAKNPPKNEDKVNKQEEEKNHRFVKKEVKVEYRAKASQNTEYRAKNASNEQGKTGEAAKGSERPQGSRNGDARRRGGRNGGGRGGKPSEAAGGQRVYKAKNDSGNANGGTKLYGGGYFE